MINQFTNFANRDVMELVIADYNSQKPILNFPLANATATSVTGDAVYAYGGHNRPQRVSFYGNRSGEFRIETQMQNYALYSIMTGASVENTAKFIEREEITATEDGTLELANAPVGDVNVFTAADDCGTPLEGATAAGAVLSCDGVVSGESYVVYYIKEYTQGVTNIRIKANTVPKNVTIYGTTFSKTEDDEIVAQKVVVYKAAPNLEAEWGFSNDGDPSTLTLTFTMLADKKDDALMDLITIEE